MEAGESGVEAGESGVEAGESGVEAGESGVEAGESGVEAGKFGWKLPPHWMEPSMVKTSVVAITGASQSTIIAIILVLKQYDSHHHYGSPLK